MTSAFATSTATKSLVTELLLVANPDPIHVGSHFLSAARELGVPTAILDVQLAYAGPRWRRSVYWHLLDHRPTCLQQFSSMILAQCRKLSPKYLLATGLAPISASDLQAIGNLGIKRLNFLTDDPWNVSHRSDWFLQALPFYDHVFNPRLSNLGDLAEWGCRASYLPFAYAPGIHFRFPAQAESEIGPDIAFIGGGDPDRVSALSELLKTGMQIDLHGGYWERYVTTRQFARGMADPEAVRRIAAMAKVSLCIVRQANRDQSCMRTFELAAMGACILAEDSKEHHEIYGQEGFVAYYFRNSTELIEKARCLVLDDSLRHNMRQNTRLWLKQRRDTYQDRLRAILATVSSLPMV